MSGGGGILVVGVNWLGDGCMTMPALQVFRQRHPQARLTMLVKPPLTALWQLHPAVDAILTLKPGNAGLWQTAAAVRSGHFDTAYIFPNSWRSALVPFLAGIPERIGTGGHSRGILLTRRVRLSPSTRAGHQQWEYVDILQLADVAALPAPALALPLPDAVPSPASGRLPVIGLIPGAARGSSKQWPEAHFIAAARLIRKARACRFTIFGTAAEAPVCNRLAAALQPDAETLAGRTTLAQLAAALAACDTVICNDSGGMHLAAAAGTPVVAIYGLTDPDKTGPLGSGHQCIQSEPRNASRDIARHDPRAAQALYRIAPGQVAGAVLQTLTHRNPPA